MTSNPALGPLINAEPARQHACALMAAGVSVRRMASAAGINPSIINGILYTRGSQPRGEKLRQANAEAILAVRAADVTPGTLDATGTRRRLQALVAVGWPLFRIGPALDMYPSMPGHLLMERTVYPTTAQTVAAGYGRLWNTDPRMHGIPPGSITRALRYARAQRWAPPAAWDDETIDDPTAGPEWTGYCGTRRGWHLHQRDGLPTCDRCAAAASALGGVAAGAR
ncbi:MULTISPECIES: hypothetical protein [Streptomyces]|uniref:hypothetical protein n=1 Tax=Streptomyces TaxID=1883 RepID=UPI0004CCD511|nr:MULTISPECIES: hypothetical protein [Streptomyces]